MLDYAEATERRRALQGDYAAGVVIEIPSGRGMSVMGAALHSETLETILVACDPDRGDWIGLAPDAASRTGEVDAAGAEAFLVAQQKEAVRHRKGGAYTRVARLRVSGGEMVLYVSHADGTWWARTAAEFDDGRFSASAESPLSASEILA